jgi:hypothetical protein
MWASRKRVNAETARKHYFDANRTRNAVGIQHLMAEVLIPMRDRPAT